MWIFLSWVIFSFCVAILAGKRGRSAAEFFLLAIFLSPLVAGFILLCMDDLLAKERAKSVFDMQMEMRALQEQLEEIRKMQTACSSGRSLLPPDVRDLINVSRGGEDLGSLSVAEVRRMLDDGRLSFKDYFYNTLSNEWLELAVHPKLNPA